MKTCAKCKIEKPKSEFSKNKTKKDGLQARCKSCNKKYVIENKKCITEKRRIHYEKNRISILRKNEEYRILNLEKISKKRKEYSIKNASDISIKRSAYYSKNKSKLSEYAKKYRINNATAISISRKNKYIANSEERLKKAKDYYKRNSDAIKKRVKAYRQKNPDKVLDANRKYRDKNRRKVNDAILRNRKARRDIDKLYDLSLKIRCLISASIRNGGYTKKSKTYEILGCSIIEFKSHIENLFTEGMTWENRKEWHLDHYIPVSSAKNEDELLNLNHFSNFRPLWAIDNLKKGNKMPDIESLIS